MSHDTKTPLGTSKVDVPRRLLGMLLSNTSRLRRVRRSLGQPYGPVLPNRMASSSSWMMMRGVTVSISVLVVRPIAVFLNKRFT